METPMALSRDSQNLVETFMVELVQAMGLSLSVTVTDMPDHLSVVLEGEDGEWLVRRKGEALDALQHILNTALRRDVDKGASASSTASTSERARTANSARLRNF